MFSKRHLFSAAILLASLIAPRALAEDLRFNRYYSDGMVLQREKPLVLRGFAQAGAEVAVSFGGQSQATEADDSGAWSVTLEPLSANAKGQPLTLTSGGERVALKDVQVGDVFLLARQSSIDVSLGSRMEDGRGVAASAPFRVIQIETRPAADPMADLAPDATDGWTPLTRKSALTMSAYAYHFAMGLTEKVDVPVGIVDLDMGSGFPINWLSRDALLETSKFYGKNQVDGVVSRFDKLLELHRQGEPMPPKDPVQSDPLSHPLSPATGYNAVLHPLRGITFKGVVLQLGNNYPYMPYTELENEGLHLSRPELNTAYVQTYDIRKTGFRIDPVTTPRVPEQLRAVFGDASLPIGLVQVPGSALGTLADRATQMRELQRQMARDGDHLGLIVPDMDSVPMSMQPADERIVGERSLHWALGKVYGGEGVTASGPMFDRIEPYLNAATIYFKPGTADGLKQVGDGQLTGFEAAGVEGDYTPAQAQIEGDTIKISSDTVSRVIRVRYNWDRHPEHTLVNEAGLPAAAFRSVDEEYQWFFRHDEDDLPMEYSTPANQWESGDVTLVNGQIKTFGYQNFAGWLGPVGVRVGPFGPNMAVRDVLVGSPAEGKLKVGDVIYSANGKMLGDEAERVMSAAITESETLDGGGKLVLGLRRGDQLLDVEVTLEVMGSYSPTAPYNCPKSEKIVADLEQWLVERGGMAGNFLSTDSLFLLGAGTPEHQHLVRRYIYDKFIDGEPGDVNWSLGYNGMLMGEYYLATGDRNVLPAMKRWADKIALNQIGPEDARGLTGRIGGWFQRGKGRFQVYPAMPPAAAACVIALHLAREAGVDIDEDAYQAGLEYFRKKGAPVAQVIYGNAWRDTPQPYHPDAIASGQLSSDNGKISVAGVLFELVGDRRTSHLCSFVSTYAYNNTYEGHGGNFWNNFWTPIGASVHSKPAFIHFMEGHRWYRELNRIYDGGLIINSGDRVGAGHGLALVIPHQRLRILGAPTSPFAVDAPELLKPALAAYAQRDYARCEAIVTELIDSGTVNKDDMPTVAKLAEEARTMQRSLSADIARIEDLAKEGRIYEGKLDLKNLKALLPEGDPRLARVSKALAGPARDNDAELYRQTMAKALSPTSQRVPDAEIQNMVWTPLTTEIYTDEKQKRSGIPGKVADSDSATQWRLEVVEHMSQAPKDWVRSSFDDATWDETALPISWPLNHTALLRTTFKVEDKDTIDKLRFRAWLFRQQDIEIYLNGQLIGKVNNLKKKTGNVDAVFNDGALNPLRNGENTLAISTRQNWRWGMLFMRVYNDGFGFMLDAGREAPDAEAQK